MSPPIIPPCPLARRKPKSRPRSYRNKAGYSRYIASPWHADGVPLLAFVEMSAIGTPEHRPWWVEARESAIDLKRVQPLNNKKRDVRRKKKKKKKKKIPRDRPISLQPKQTKRRYITEHPYLSRWCTSNVCLGGVPVPCQAAFLPPPPCSSKAFIKKAARNCSRTLSYLSGCASSSSSRSGRPSSSLSGCANRRQANSARGTKRGSKEQRLHVEGRKGNGTTKGNGHEQGRKGNGLAKDRKG